MKEWLVVLRAADAAARWHVHQKRKGAAEMEFVPRYQTFIPPSTTTSIPVT
jgi:hypothetical protein